MKVDVQTLIEELVFQNADDYEVILYDGEKIYDIQYIEDVHSIDKKFVFKISPIFNEGD